MQKEKAQMSDFYHLPKLTGFVRYMELRKLAPNTVSNKSKSLVRVSLFFSHTLIFKVINWMKTQSKYANVLTKLEHACMYLNDRVRIMENRNHVRRCKQASESQLLEEGKLMTEQELRQFYEKILEEINELVVQCNSGALEEDEAAEFQSLLMTMLLFTIGGQRKEVIMGLTVEVFFLFP